MTVNRVLLAKVGIAFVVLGSLNLIVLIWTDFNNAIAWRSLDTHHYHS